MSARRVQAPWIVSGAFLQPADLNLNIQDGTLVPTYHQATLQECAKAFADPTYQSPQCRLCRPWKPFPHLATRGGTPQQTYGKQPLRQTAATVQDKPTP